ncbi:MAG: hypothetical protein RIF33_17875 [Cyclobacteriaceae bacterium]
MAEDQQLKGFNHGYLLRQHAPEIYHSLIRADGLKSEYMKAMIDGGEQYQYEVDQKESKDSPEPSKEIDIDDLIPERTRSEDKSKGLEK